MGKLADLTAQKQAEGRSPCSTGLLLDQLDKSMRTDLVGLLSDASVTTSAIASALSELGYRVAVGNLRRHRKGECRCPRG